MNPQKNELYKLIQPTKSCTKCGAVKELCEFNKEKRARDGHTSQCKACLGILQKKIYQENKEERKIKARKYYSENKLKAKERDLKRRKEINAWHEEWVNKNYRKWREINNKANRKRRSTAKGRLNHSISSYIRKSLKNGSKSERNWESLVGYTLSQLQRHLEKQFQAGMTWDNYGEWHIDHKIPLSVFNFEHPEDIDFKRAWDLKNLQPLWATDNIVKNAKISKPFQPALSMGI